MKKKLKCEETSICINMKCIKIFTYYKIDQGELKLNILMIEYIDLKFCMTCLSFGHRNLFYAFWIISKY